MAFTLPDSIPSRAIGDTRRSCAAAMVTTDKAGELVCQQRNGLQAHAVQKAELRPNRVLGEIQGLGELHPRLSRYSCWGRLPAPE